jgi:hypothetical protein
MVTTCVFQEIASLAVQVNKAIVGLQRDIVIVSNGMWSPVVVGCNGRNCACISFVNLVGVVFATSIC